MTLKRRFATCLLALALLGGCAEEPPKTGKVLDKKFVAAHEEDNSYTSCSGVGSSTVCYPIIDIDYVEDAWFLFLENCDKVKKNGEPQCYKGYRPVTHTDYEQTLVGDYYGGPKG